METFDFLWALFMSIMITCGLILLVVVWAGLLLLPLGLASLFFDVPVNVVTIASSALVALVIRGAAIKYQERR